MTDAPRVLPPFGLRLGLLISFILFGIVPFIKVLVAYRLNFNEDDIVWRLPFDFWSQAIGVGCLVSMVVITLAWKGKPSDIRWGVQAVLVLMMVLISIEAAIRYSDDCAPPLCRIYPHDDVLNLVFRLFLPFQGFTLVYMLWYINRAPARAFYEQKSLEHV